VKELPQNQQGGQAQQEYEPAGDGVRQAAIKVDQ